MKILAHTSFIGTTGYNNHARSFFTALNKFHEVKVRNFTVGSTWKGMSDRPHDDEPYMTDEMREMLIQQTLWEVDGTRKDYPIYGYQDDFLPDVHIILEEVDQHYFYDDYQGYKIAYTVWESTRYPEHFFQRLLTYDELWVPTKWQRDCSIEQGYPPEKVFIIPEGVDIDTFYPLEKHEKVKKDKFRFLLFGRWDYRKSTKEIIETFAITFREDEDVELICSVDNPFPVDGMNSTEERFKHYNIKHKNIKIIHFPSREEYVKYLREGDVFVSCARSEGWNLPLIEAMACGTPSIYSNWGAQLQFAQNKGIPVNIIGEVPANLGTDKGWNGNAPGNYCEPDFTDLSLKMREVYDNYDEYRKKAFNDSQIIRHAFDWEDIAESASIWMRAIEINHLRVAEERFGLRQVKFEIESFLSFMKTQSRKNVVEIGTDMGGTFYLWCSMFSGKKISIDIPHGNFGRNGFDFQKMNREIKGKFSEVYFLHGDSKAPSITDLTRTLLNGEKLDFLFIDGDHTFEGVLGDFLIYKQFVKEDGWIGFHDIKGTQFHHERNCYVDRLWDALRGDKIEFVSTYEDWAGIGLIRNNGNLKLEL